MSTEIKITADNLLNISTKLDALDLSVEEKGLLCAVFQSAGCQLHGEVSGFNLDGVVGVGNAFGALLHSGPDGTTVGAGAAGAAVIVGSASTGTGAILQVPGLGDTTFVIS